MARSPSAAAMITVLALALLAYSVRGQCEATDISTGNYYNLAPACRETDYTYPANQNKELFWLQPCCATTKCATIEQPYGGPWLTPLCQQDGVGVYHSCGNFSTVAWSFGPSGPTISFTGGDDGRQVQINLVCSHFGSRVEGPVGEPVRW